MARSIGERGEVISSFEFKSARSCGLFLLYIARVKRIAFVLFFIASLSARGQEISPLVSFEFGSPLFFNRDAGVLNQFSGDSAGTSSSYSYGIGADVRWPKLVGDLGIASNLQFLYSTGRFSFDAAGANVTGVGRKLRMELCALESIENFGIRAGGWVSSRLSANVDEHDSSGTDITPPNATSAPFHAGVVLATDYRFGNLRASLFGNYDLTANAGLHGLGAGVSLSYVLTGETDQTDLSATQAVATVPRSTATVQFTVNDTAHYTKIPLEKVELNVHEYSMQPDTVVVKEWIEESYHLPRIRLQVSVHEPSYVIVTANESLLNRYRVRRDSALTINDLSALDIHRSNRIVAQVENGTSADTLILPDISSNSLTGTISQSEYRFHLIDRDTANFNKLLARMTALTPNANNIIVRTPHGANWQVLTQKLHSALGDKAKYRSAYNAKEISVAISE
jgi:hypothetical protein